MSATRDIRMFTRYSAWANARMFDTLAQLPEGEAVANTRRQNKIDSIQNGFCNTVVDASAVPAMVTSNLPSSIDAATTALWTQSVLGAERPVPIAVAVQVQAILTACKKNKSEPLV